jgi:radical SAM enzyme (rSAM/lipoprotein system)
MPLADFIRAIDSIAPHVNPNKTMIVLTGGEPLMRKDLEQCGEALYRRGFPWGMVTNGMALTEKRFIQLEKAGLRAITISLDGFAEAHNRLRGHPSSYQNALQAIQTVVHYGTDTAFDVVTCVNQWNFNELPDLKEVLIAQGVKAWRIFTIFPIGRAAENEDLQLNSQQFGDLFRFIAETRKEGRIKTDYGCEGFLGAYENEVRDGFFMCRAGITTGSILVDGSISACPNLRSNFVQGNIYRDDFMDVWNNRYQVFRDRKWAKQGICADCSFFKYCTGNGMHLRDENGGILFCHLNRLKEANISY